MKHLWKGAVLKINTNFEGVLIFDKLFWLKPPLAPYCIPKFWTVPKQNFHPFCSNVSLFFIFPDLPEAPGQPKVEQITKDSATISWTPPDNDGGAPIENYVIEFREQGQTKWQQVRRDEKSPDLTFTVPGLREETQYEFRVAAENKAGQGPFSKPSEPAKFGELIGQSNLINQLINLLQW